MKPSQVQSTAILHDIRQRKPWEEVKKTAKSFGDKKWIANQKQKIKSKTQPYGHNFEAVATYKQYCDIRDPYYIYKMNDKRGNPDRPSFVFKSSKLGAKFALNMTEDEDHILSKEFCCFDGKVNRCKGLVTLTASVYHPILRKQVILASMESESESTETVALFWSHINKILSKVTGLQGFMFNPRGWCLDMAGLNLQGLKQVFGDDALQKVKGCEFHFKQCRNRHARTLRSEETRQKCTKLCDALLSTATPPAYYSAKEDLTKFIDEAPEEREHLMTWIKWWDDRRAFIFPAFAPWDGAPKMNQAEVIHASWAHRDRENMTLLDAAECHVRDCVLLETEYEGTKQGKSRPGTGPSLMQRRARETTIQQKGLPDWAKSFCERISHRLLLKQSLKVWEEKFIQLVVIVQTNQEKEIPLVQVDFVQLGLHTFCHGFRKQNKIKIPSKSQKCFLSLTYHLVLKFRAQTVRGGMKSKYPKLQVVHVRITRSSTGRNFANMSYGFTFTS